LVYREVRLLGGFLQKASGFAPRMPEGESVVSG
jgi:hypothetical protein